MSAKKHLMAQFDLHNTLYNNVLVDINEEEANVQLAPDVNNVKWLAGHLVWGQNGLANIAGVLMNIEWLDHYNTQLKGPVEIKAEVPSLGEIKKAWNKVTPLIREGLEKLSEEALDTPADFPMPAFRSLGGLWTFINHHQAYTIGQVGIFRRVLGKEAMKYI